MLRQIAALVFIFICTTIAWIILGSTIYYRTDQSDRHLRGSVGSTWGTAQEQAPPMATYKKPTLSTFTKQENGQVIVHQETVNLDTPLPTTFSRVNVDLHLDHRQKGLMWYSTYVVDFSGDYKFRNDTDKPQTVTFRLRFPVEKAVYNGLTMTLNHSDLRPVTNDLGAAGEATMQPGETASLHVAYRSQGMNSWRYKFGEGVVQVHDFSLSMRTNFEDIDFADDTLSPTSKRETANGWELGWTYSDLISGFAIGMTMPEKLQPGPLAGQISYFAPVSLFFFFFLIFIITTLRNIDFHPMNYFFLATAFFAFHLLLAYLVDHISIHAAMAIASVVSIALVVSYLRLVVGIRFAALEAGTAQLIYLVVFSYAFFWKGFTGLAITVISVITLFIVMQATGRIRWSENFRRAVSSKG